MASLRTVMPFTPMTRRKLYGTHLDEVTLSAPFRGAVRPSPRVPPSGMKDTLVVYVAPVLTCLGTFACAVIQATYWA